MYHEAEHDKETLERLVSEFEELFQLWYNCIECQYNVYICGEHSKYRFYDYLVEYGTNVHGIDFTGEDSDGEE